LNEAIVPDRVKVSGTLPACSDGVAASVIEKRNVQRLVNITDPMSQRFQGDQTGCFRFCSNTQNLEVAQDRRKNARVSQRALVRGKSFGISRQIQEMLRCPYARVVRMNSRSSCIS
jgi:hypothetical protein